MLISDPIKITMETNIITTEKDITYLDIFTTDIVNTYICSNIITAKGETGSNSFKLRFTTNYFCLCFNV